MRGKYDELKQFKNDPEFHRVGFGRGHRYYREWLKPIDERIDSIGAPAPKELFEEGVALGDLSSLGMEYMRTNGQENEVTRAFDEYVREYLDAD